MPPRPVPTPPSQRAQLCDLLRKLRREHRPALCVVCGDLNEEAAGLLPDLGAPPCRLRRLSRDCAQGTCLRDDGSGEGWTLDHIFAGGEGGDEAGEEAAVAAGLAAAAEGGPSASCASACAEVTCDQPLPPPLRSPLSDHSLVWAHNIRSGRL